MRPPTRVRNARLHPYPRVLIAGLASGTGKTSVTAGILSALARRKVRRAAFKCGPDFLDPQVLRFAGDLPSVGNLDLWLTSRERMRTSFLRHAPPDGNAITLVEGVMGLFDTSVWGTSTVDVARTLRLPIVLVVDAARSVESVAASVRGTASFLPPGYLSGVIVDRAARGWHSQTVRSAIEKRGRVPVLGVLPWDGEVALPEKHLGLATPETTPGDEWNARVKALASWATEHIDIDRLRSIAQRARSLPSPTIPPREATLLSHRTSAKVAVASDAAFCFTYPESLEALREGGGGLRPFSPVAGDPLPPDADSVYLPGGYPELHAPALAANERLRAELRGWVHDGRPLYAECGGMMFLLDSLVDAAGKAYPMAGAFPGTSVMTTHLSGFGYGEALLRRSCLYGKKGDRVRGHLYHHSRREASIRTAWGWTFEPRNGGSAVGDGYCKGGSLAGYLHVRMDDNPQLLQGLLEIGQRPNGAVRER